MSPLPPFRIFLLGGFRFEQHGQPAPLPATHAARLVLAYLLINPEFPHERAELARLIWPGERESEARRNLSKALWLMKQTFPYVTNTRKEIRLTPSSDLWVDVWAFLKARQRAEEAVDEDARIRACKEAIVLYGGPLLPGYEEYWVRRERSRLQKLFKEAVNCVL